MAETRNPSPKVCVIGGGGSGLAMLKSLKQSSTDFNITLYEKSTDVSGLWFHTDHLENIGGPGKLYRNLRYTYISIRLGCY